MALNEYVKITGDIGESLVLSAKEELLQRDGVSQRAYRLIYAGSAPWEVGSPQRAVVEIAEMEEIRGPVLDVGCGYGANARYLASLGLEVLAIDYLQEVVGYARTHSDLPTATFEVMDALTMGSLVSRFNTVLDSATFHGFSDSQRLAYAEQLRMHMRVGSVLYILGFSADERRSGGPRRLSEDMIRQRFAVGWSIEYVRATAFDTTIFDGSVAALVARIRRV